MDALRTSQTRFYCTFSKKARLIVPSVEGHDYYLLLVPLLLLLICVSLYCNVLSRLRERLAMLIYGRSRIKAFHFGRDTVPWHEEQGRELLYSLQHANRQWAEAVLYRAGRRMLELRGKSALPSPTSDRQLRAEQLSKISEGECNDAHAADDGLLAALARRNSSPAVEMIRQPSGGSQQVSPHECDGSNGGSVTGSQQGSPLTRSNSMGGSSRGSSQQASPVTRANSAMLRRSSGSNSQLLGAANYRRSSYSPPYESSAGSGNWQQPSEQQHRQSQQQQQRQSQQPSSSGGGGGGHEMDLV